MIVTHFFYSEQRVTILVTLALRYGVVHALSRTALRRLTSRKPIRSRTRHYMVAQLK